ncbi:hypothetical protein C8R45DRAFT_1042545 [Mycena sanguinolenta]|nr:hypothetical protein C8R45DRAFT_1042545 [Mycena sanguinolenta]
MIPSFPCKCLGLFLFFPGRLFLSSPLSLWSAASAFPFPSHTLFSQLTPVRTSAPQSYPRIHASTVPILHLK